MKGLDNNKGTMNTRKRMLVWILLGAAGAAAAVWLVGLPPRQQTLSDQKERPGTEETAKLLQNTEWPMYRGNPALTGVAAAALPERLGLLWKYKTGAAVKSSAAIEGGQVYIGSDDQQVYCLSLADGQLRWAFATGGAVESSPGVWQGRVYAGSADMHLYAIDQRSGQMVWKYKTGGKIPGGVNYYRKAGEKDPWILIGSYDNILHCVNAVTGAKVWSYESDYYINGTPAVLEDKVVFGGCDAIIHVISAADGQSIHEIDAGSYIAGSAALAGGRAFVGNYDFVFMCADLQTGQIAWSYQDQEYPFFSTAAVTETEVVFGSRDKRLHSVRRDNGQPLWTFATQGEVDSSPIICGDKVLVGSGDGRLYMVRLADGAEVWSYEIGAAITASPAIAEGIVVVGAEDGFVYAFTGQQEQKQD